MIKLFCGLSFCGDWSVKNGDIWQYLIILHQDGIQICEMPFTKLNILRKGLARLFDEEQCHVPCQIFTL